MFSLLLNYESRKFYIFLRSEIVFGPTGVWLRTWEMWSKQTLCLGDNRHENVSDKIKSLERLIKLRTHIQEIQ
jgi:hypothetical protein